MRDASVIFQNKTLTPKCEDAMQELFNQYYQAMLAKYLARNEKHDSYSVHLATQSAKFALDDLVSTMRRNAEIYSQDQLIELMGQYVEDAA